MDTNTLLKQCFLDGASQSSGAVMRIEAPVEDDVRRSESNILQWMSYLPDDCIKTMIAMGWDSVRKHYLIESVTRPRRSGNSFGPLRARQ
jgi:hypothetical protein